jgi:putative SOS response-associated peptidase YedK
MCGRYQFDFSNKERFKKRYHIDGRFPSSEIKTRYNAAPGQKLPTIVTHSPNSVEIMLWGLIPYWEEKKENPHGLINITSEKAIIAGWAKKWIQFQRCLVPSSGFYEWKKTSDGKIPYRIYVKDKEYFSFAGLYSVYKNPETGREEKNYAILTTQPNDFMKSIHHRMPVILDEEKEEDWLNPDTVEIEHLKKFLNPFQGKLEAYPISTRINNPIFDDKSLINPEN